MVFVLDGEIIPDNDPRAIARRRGETSGRQQGNSGPRISGIHGNGGNGNTGQARQQGNTQGFGPFGGGGGGGAGQGAPRAPGQMLQPGQPIGDINESLKKYVQPIPFAGTVIQPIAFLAVGLGFMLAGQQGILFGLMAYYVLTL
eukprot:m.42735 g.42735  ORF g.42735 m.42735 type:complete len:144 (-) comp9906_c0_seq2:139-570(-)